ncbi:hypothetical protein [Leucobacter sp. USHLN153]|uniref:hypothetical protein n=1 Tax=Leucobacter sp. USHLN153 TaxID=3081268 RepID=UPI003019349F
MACTLGRTAPSLIEKARELRRNAPGFALQSKEHARGGDLPIPQQIFSVKPLASPTRVVGTIETFDISEVLHARRAVLLSVIFEEPPCDRIDEIETADPQPFCIKNDALQFQVVDADRLAGESE